MSTEELVTISDCTITPDGIRTHLVSSPYQAGETKIHVLLPSHSDHLAPLRTLYVLPVERLDGRVWGDALGEVRAHQLHERYGLACVMPSFSHAPWYADHHSDPHIRQESYLLRVVVPFIEQTYPVLAAREGRLLVGFSKSGWGAYSLLLRHPDLFSKAAAWDAPLGQTSHLKYGMSVVFALQDTLDQYQIWELLRRDAPHLGPEPRLALLGYGDFRGHHQATHHFMRKLGIPHEYQDGPKRKHHWESGWLPEAVRFLAGAEVSEC